MKHQVGDVWQNADGWFVRTYTDVIRCRSRGEALSKRPKGTDKSRYIPQKYN